MYLLAAYGLWVPWRHRADAQGASRHRMNLALMGGLSLWYIVNSVLSHQLLSLHHIRLDNSDPLLWNLIRFAFCAFCHW